MKSLWIKIKWIFEKTKSFRRYIVIIIILGALTAILGIYRALVTKWLVDSATAVNIKSIYINLTILGTIILSDVVLRAISTVIVAKGSIGISNNIQQKLYNRIIRTKWMDFLKYHSGDYLTRMTSDVEAITAVVIKTLPNIVSICVLIIGSFISILFIDSLLAVLISLVLPIAILFARFYSKKLKRIYLKNQEVESKYRSFINESIQNILIVKAFCLENTNISKIHLFQRDRVKLVLSRAKLSILSSSTMSIGTWTGFFVVFIWGSFKLANGTTTFGTLMALIQLIGNIQGPFSTLASSLPKVVYSIASTERLMEIENLPLDSEGIKVENMNIAGIIFENVSFSYKQGEHVLNNISITIKPSEIIGLVGPSGEGKTTFIHLILSLINSDSGHIYIYNETKKNEVSTDSRRLISYVPQGNNLFSGTIADNLRFGSPDATDQELEIAAKSACAWDFINEASEGLYTHVGERGTGLSEGQAQRIAIARALLHKAPILLLDEVTSALDSKTEIEVLETIKNLPNAPTCIIITHRSTALNICDRILEIEDNRLTEHDFEDEIIYDDISS